MSDLVKPVEENLWSMWAQFGRGEGCLLIDEPDLMRFETPLAKIPYNSVFRFRLADDVDPRVDQIVSQYDRRGVPWLASQTDLLANDWEFSHRSSGLQLTWLPIASPDQDPARPAVPARTPAPQPRGELEGAEKGV